MGAAFVWCYTERGQKSPLEHFQTEAAAVNFAFDQIRADPWANAHCVGFTMERSESIELAEMLRDLGIDCKRNVIPYAGPDRPAYRTFVFGCAIRQVEHLKAKYCKAG